MSSQAIASSAPALGPSRATRIIASIALILALLLSSGLLILHFYGTLTSVNAMAPWQLYIGIIIAWMPFYLYETLVIARSSLMRALFFVLVVAQSLHFIEHIAQMVQIHLLGLSGTQAHGLIGMLDLEWVHFIFDGIIIPICTVILLFAFRRNPWLWILLPLAFWHATEHVVIISYYLRTGIAGSPGLLAQGGLINGGLPLTRPDLHFLYNLAEESLILLGFVHQSRQMRKMSEQKGT